MSSLNSTSQLIEQAAYDALSDFQKYESNVTYYIMNPNLFSVAQGQLNGGQVSQFTASGGSTISLGSGGHVRVTPISGSATNATGVLSPAVPVVPGQAYLVRLYVKRASFQWTITTEVKISWQDAQGNEVGTTDGTIATIAASYNVDEARYVRGEAPSTAVQAAVYAGSMNAAPTSSALLDVGSYEMRLA